MSNWTWEYVPDAANVVGGLTQKQIDEVESHALRIADAVAVRRKLQSALGTAAPCLRAAGQPGHRALAQKSGGLRNSLNCDRSI